MFICLVKEKSSEKKWDINDIIYKCKVVNDWTAQHTISMKPVT
jgi:hypothetical protein